MFERDPIAKSNPIGFKPTPTIKYVSDGSGWDFYVTQSSGGLQAPYVAGVQWADI